MQNAPAPNADQAIQTAIGHHQAGRLPEATAIYEKILRANPRHADALHLSGLIALQMGEAGIAVDMIGKAIETNPHYLYYSNLGSAFKKLEQPDAASECYRKSILLKPDYAEAHYNLGVVLQAQGRLDDAIECYRKAISLRPEYAEAYGNLGATFQAQGKLDEAVEIYHKALLIKPGDAVTYNNLSTVSKIRYRFPEALAYANRAVELNPHLAAACQSVAMMLGHLSDYSKVTEYSNAALANDANDPAIWESRLYIYSYHPDLSAEEIFAEFIRWGERFALPPPNQFPTRDRTPTRRLRIGYVSPDFRQHTSRFFFEPLFTNHDRNQVELFAYSNVKVEDAYTQRFKELFDQWRDISRMADQDAANMIRRDEIDILIDGCGHMMNDRLGMFALKPTPIQVTWLGAAWTTGLPMMDYALFDWHEAPAETLAREKIVRLPSAFFVFRPEVETAVSSLPAAKNGYITFGYSGRSERLNHRVFHAWAEILRRVPDARLILDFPPFADPPTQAYYREFLAKHGVDADRVVMRKSTNIFDGLGDMDILLDSFPHNGGTMLIDALWMGVPALTLASRPTLGRIGASMMKNLGLGNWVAQSEKEYVDKAVGFALDIGQLNALRAGMRERMKNSPLMDESGFAKGVEAAYRAMWQRWCAGLPPEDISIGSAPPSPSVT